MTDEQKTNHAFARSRSNAGLGLRPVAWRRTDTARTLVTENEDIARGWEADELFYEPLYSEEQMAKMQIENVRLRSAIQQTLDENGHLADGEVCTLAALKLAIEPPNDKHEGREPARRSVPLDAPVGHLENDEDIS